MNRISMLAGILLLMSCAGTNKQDPDTPAYSLVTYNIENLFDADGEAVFNDYKPTDRDGNPQYTPKDVLTKVKNAVEVLKMYNNGKGPDVIAAVELESDSTPAENREEQDATMFLREYEGMTLEALLTSAFHDGIADMPSEWLLLKGMADAGMWKYNVAVGYPPLENGRPASVQQTALYSRFPILEEKTKIHTVKRARPILEVWLDVDGAPLVVFVNHWKSGASNQRDETTRVQNAGVLRDRLNELFAEQPDLDVVLAGDFNADYNQKARYGFDPASINDVLKSSGDEQQVAFGEKELYNLWYELPFEERGSDTYRGYWGTLMQLMISHGMYDQQGIQYVNNSFSRGMFSFNSYSTSGTPKRWSSVGNGSGYSDHLPVAMQFRVAGDERPTWDFSVTDDSLWKPVEVTFSKPVDVITMEQFTAVDPTGEPSFFDEYVYLEASVTGDREVTVAGSTYQIYTPSFRFNEVVKEGDEIRFYGRFSQYRGNWQFIIEDKGFIEVLP